MKLHFTRRILSILVIFSFIFQECLPYAMAAEFSVFKKTYVRSNDTPTTETDSFAALNPNKPYTLKVINGLPDGSNRVSSAEGFLNDSQFLKPNQLNQNVGQLETSVSLKPANQISMQLRSKPQSQLTVEITGIDDQPPILTWLSPINNALFEAQPIPSELKLSDDNSGIDPSTLTILLDNISVKDSFLALNAPTLDATLQANLNASHGHHTLTAQVKDIAGNPAQASVSFTVNKKPIADAGPNRDSFINTTVTLDGSLSSDPDNDPLSYNWSFVSRPDGSIAILNNPTTVQPTFTADKKGAFILQLIVNDGFIDSDPSTVTVTIINRAPIANAGIDQNVYTGDSVTLDGSASSDLDGDSLTCHWALISKPDGSAAILSDETAVNPMFVPDLAGSYVAQLIVNDGIMDSAPDSVTITAITPELPPPQTTPQSGFIHGYVFNASTDLPLEGAIVTVQGIEGAVVSDSQGKFTFPTPGNGTFSLTVKKKGFTYAQREVKVITTRDRAVEPVYLSPIDPKVTTITQEGGTATNSTGSIELVFPPEAVSADINVSATQYQHSKELPSPLPEQSFFTYALDLEPDGTTFKKPVKLRISNQLHFAPGTPIPMGFYNKIAHKWEDAGMGVVSADGAWAEFEITHFSPYDCNLPTVLAEDAASPPAIDPKSDGDHDPQKEKDPGEARIGVKSGSVSVDYSLPAVRSLGKTDSLTFTYNSRTVNLDVLIGTRALFNPGVLLTPQTTTFEVNFAGKIENVTFQGENWDLHQRIILEAKNGRGQMLPTGNYLYSIKLSNEYQAEYATAEYFGGPPIEGTGILAPELRPLPTPLAGNVVINNQIESPFGAGWSLQGLQRLHFNPDETILITEGDGSALTFLPASYAHSFLQNGQKDPECPYGILTGYSPECLSFDRQGNIYAVDRFGGRVVKGAPDGTITIFASGFNSPRGIAFDSLGNAYVSDVYGATGTIFYKIAPSGERSTFYTNSYAVFWDMVFDKDDNLYVANTPPFKKSLVLKITPNGEASTYATVDGLIYGLTFDKENNLYVTETVTATYELDGGIYSISGANRVFQVTPDGFISTYAIGFGAPRGLAFDEEGNLYVADAGNIFRVTPDRIVEPVVVGDSYGSGFPPVAASIGFSGANDLAFDQNGNLFSTNRIFSRTNLFLLGTVSIIKPTNLYIPPAGDYTELVKNLDGTFTRTTKDGTRTNFNQNGLQTSIVDRNGNTTTYNYDEENRLISITDPVGRVTTFSYDGSGHLEKVIDPVGRITSFQVDANGNLIRITAPDNSVTQYAYDTRNLLTAQTNPGVYTTNYVYDELGRIKEEIYPEREVIKDGILARERERIEFQPVDVQGLINDLEEGVGTPENPAPITRDDDIKYQITHGSTITTGITNQFGALIKETDALGNTTTIERDGNNNPTKIIRPNGLETRFTYDARGNITQTSSSFQPEFGLPITLSSGWFSYESKFNQIAEIFSPQPRTAFKYDDNGNLIQVAAPYGFSPFSDNTYFGCDDRGLLTSITDALGNITTSTYDGKGNFLTTTNPLGNTTALTYDEAGSIISSTDAEGRITRFEYDQMNRLTAVIDADGNITRYEYDTNGNLIKIVDAKGNIITFEYDERDQLVKTTNPLGQKKQFLYDINSNLASVIDANGNIITFSYDALNRLIKKTLPDDVVRFTYNSVGNLTSVEDNDSKLVMEYDPLSRLNKVITGDPANPNNTQPVTTITYAYDINGNRVRMTDPQGGITNYTYDSYNRLTKLINPQLETINFTYDSLSRRKGMTLPNGAITTYTYDEASQLLSMNHQLSTIAQLYSYTYDRTGNRIEMAESSGLNTYTYDDLNRLTNATHPQPNNPVEFFNYDPVGNRTSSAASSSFVYDSANRLLDDGTFTYSYDNNGNLIKKTSKSTNGQTIFSYDAENRLTRVIASGSEAIYSYNPLGRRIQKNVNGNITKYIYDNEDIILEYDSNNNVKASYTHGPEIDEPLILDKAGQKYYYHTDGLSSVTAITDSTGNVVQTYQYDSFGNIVSQTGSLTQPYTYTGREYDPETGLYYYRARYYDPTIGRFLQTDPIGYEGGINLYTYVGNNPMRWRDPLGLCEEEKEFWDRIKEFLDKILPPLPPYPPSPEPKPKEPTSEPPITVDDILESLRETLFGMTPQDIQNIIDIIKNTPIPPIF